MKHYVLMLGLAMSICITACHKYDGPLPADKRQLTYLTKDGFNPLNYVYDNNRLLTNLFMHQRGIAANFLFTYDALKRPLTMRDSIAVSYDKFIYQNGRLIRIDRYGNGTAVTGQTLFTYDYKGRITRKDGDAGGYSYVKYEYEGNSCNYKRALYYRAPAAVKTGKAGALAETASLIEAYTYDEEFNPLNTLPNFQVVPFSWSNYSGGALYEPLTPNNVRSINYYAQTDTGYYRFIQFEFIYTYDNHYPVTDVLRRTNFYNTPPMVTDYNGSYRYEKLRW